MRIAHVTATFPPYTGGTGNVAYHNALELVRRGHEVHVYTASVDGAATEELLEGIHVHRLKPWLRYGNAPLLPSLYSSLKDFELIHLHLPFYGGSEALYLLRRVKKIPLVIIYQHDVHLSGFAGFISRIHDQIIGKSLLKQADRVYFSSLDYGRYSKFGSLMRIGELREREMPNGVDVNHFTPGIPSPSLVERYQTFGCFVILFVGGLDRAHYFKGINNLIQAVADLQRDDLRLIIVGKGDMQPSYRRQVEDLNLENVVCFSGFVPDDEIPDYYRLADVTVLPSTTSGEAFGLVLIESLACGTPVIASDLTGVRTVVSSPVDGYLVEPGNVGDLAEKLDQILCLPEEERRSMGEAGRRKVEERYNWETIGATLELVYREVLGQDQSQLTEISLVNSEASDQWFGQTK